MINMNLLRRSSVLEKLCKIIVNRFVTSSVAQWKAGPLPESGLQTRLLNYLERSDDPKDNEKPSDGRELYLPTSLKSATCALTSETVDSTYDDLLESLRKRSSPAQGPISENDVRLLDKQCCRLLGESSQSEIFRLLHLLTKALPNEVTSMKYYKNALLTLRKMLELRRLDRRETVQLLFFESWNKKLGVRNVKFVMSFLPPLSELSLMEQSIVAQSAYQCSIGLAGKDVRTLQDAIERNASSLVEDTAILSTLCKAVRRAGPTSDCSLNDLSRAIVSKGVGSKLMCVAHVTSLYTEARLERPDVLQRLFDDAMTIISMNRKNKIKARIKDVDRILWASSIMNYKLRDSDINEISLFLDRALIKLEGEPFYFANILLSLWILNFKPKRLLSRFFSNGVFRPIIEERKLWKPKARLHLLVSCVKIEAPEIALPNELAREYVVGLKVPSSVKRLQKTIGMSLDNRYVVGLTVPYSVRRLQEIIDRLKSTLEIDEVTIDYPVNGLFIAGVSLRRGDINVHVDLLDETNCFRGTVVPRGLMNLKLRLLRKIGVRSILITEAQLNDSESLSSTLSRSILDTLSIKRSVD